MFKALTHANYARFNYTNRFKMLGKRFSSNRTVRIGCASGFWGDTATAVPQLVYGGKLDYLVFDYLAETTMSLLTAAKTKMPEMGYAPDFVHFAMKPFLNEIKTRGIKVISNAGGINPIGCARALQKVAQDDDVELNIAVVTGDDLMGKIDYFSSLDFLEGQAGNKFPTSVTSMNVYLGCGGIVKALQNGADIVITGRCVDSAVTLGPLMHEFNWKRNDWDKLAAGSLAGHLIECGAQCTGGICTSWEDVTGWDNMGFPIIECDETGMFTVTKPPKTGGSITVPNVAEQLVYEIADPQNYKLPDVVCDFSQVEITQKGEDCVIVGGAKGKPPANNFKVCATYKDGYRMTGVSPIVGPNAAEKARRTADAVLKRCRRIFKFLGMEDFRRTHVELLGSGHSYGPNAKQSEKESREVVKWVAAHHNEKRALELMARELAASGTGAAPGLTNMVGGRPKISPVLRLFSFYVPKSIVKIELHMNESTIDVEEATIIDLEHDHMTKLQPESVQHILKGSTTYKLFDLAYTRSGDKGDTSNIGVIARDPKIYPYLVHYLTAERVEAYFSHLFEPNCTQSHVTRYLLPGVKGLNFVLEGALGGGGVYSLRSDPLGKAMGQILLDLELDNMPEIENM